MIHNNEVWVTGLGTASAAGIGAPALQALLEHRETAVAALPTGDWPAGRCPSLRADPASRRLARDAQLFLLAAEEAWRDAGLDDRPAADPRRCAVVEGSSLGPLPEVMAAALEQPLGGRRARPTDVIRFMPGAGGATFAQRHAIEGMAYQIAAGSVAAAFAIIDAAARLWSDAADLMVVGGAEAPIQESVLAAFAAAGILATSASDGRCRPFDATRCGTVLGEGAGVLVLERADHARKRGARPRALITGTGLNTERAGMTGPSPDGRGVAAAAREALAMHGDRRIGWIKTHGTGTRANDLAECTGLHRIFGAGLAALPLTSLKATVGHTLGASAANRNCRRAACAGIPLHSADL